MRGNGTRPHRDLELAAAGRPNRSTATKPGPDGRGGPVSLASELRLAVAAMGVVRDVPQVLVYSIFVPLLCLGSLAAPYVFVWTVFGGTNLSLALAFPTAMLLCCLVFCVLQQFRGGAPGLKEQELPTGWKYDASRPGRTAREQAPSGRASGQSPRAEADTR